MGFGSFLKDLGTSVAKGTSTAQAGSQLVTSAIQTFAPGSNAAHGVDTFSAILGSVVAVEGTVASIAGANASGKDKAQAAGNLVAQAIMAAPFMQGKKVADQAKFQQACTTIAGGVADLLNSLQAQSGDAAAAKV